MIPTDLLITSFTTKKKRQKKTNEKLSSHESTHLNIELWIAIRLLYHLKNKQQN